MKGVVIAGLVLCRITLLWGVSSSQEQSIPPALAPEEMAALLAFKEGLIDNNGTALFSWRTDSNPCGPQPWKGIFCVSSDYPDSLRLSAFSHVTEIRLMRLNLSGKLAPELGNLEALTCLDLVGNCMSGSIPPSLGKLTNLKLLLLNGNKFTGILPEELGFLSNLNRMHIDENSISGPVPDTFENLVALQHLHMNDNSLSGRIPPGLGKLSKLVHLMLNKNQFSGPLPPELAQALELRIIMLDHNQFDTGTAIPEEYTQMPQLSKLSLRNCGLQGPVPSLNGSQNLGVLDLSGNNLNGTVPDDFPPRMKSIDLSYNNLSGTIPASLGALEELSYLLLNNNHLQDSIPVTLGTGPQYSVPDNSTIRLRIIWDLQNNNISSWPNNESLVRLEGTGSADFWFQGNPICAGQSLSSICQTNNVSIALQYGVPIHSSSNRYTSCDPCIGDGNYVLVPNASQNNCHCAVPLIVGCMLKSPNFNVFDAYEHSFIEYISDGLNISHGQLDIKEYVYNGDSGLKMNLLFFPESGSTRFNDSELTRLVGLLSDWKIPLSDTFGPYEMILLTIPGKDAHPLPLYSTFPREVLAKILPGVLVFVMVWTLLLFFISKRRVWNSVIQDGSKRPGMCNAIFSRIKVNGLTEYSLEDMVKATNNFSDENVVAVGGCGKVFVGVLESDQKVAIKRAEMMQLDASDQFETEIELLSRVHHRNLVWLQGFCNDEQTGDQLLVYEFMPNGTVEDHLPPCSSDPLDLASRLRIALGSARGINYLHTEADPPIYHRDIKTSNILLDAKFQAKVADFGVSKNAPQPDVEGKAGGGVDTVVKGTPGYLDPEYCLTHKLTDKSDVYSFGVVLLVLLTGRPAICHGKNLVRQVNVAYEAEILFSMVDPHVEGSCPREVAEAWAKLALQCCKDNPDERPTMDEVVRELENISKHCAFLQLRVES